MQEREEPKNPMKQYLNKYKLVRKSAKTKVRRDERIWDAMNEFHNDFRLQMNGSSSARTYSK